MHHSIFFIVIFFSANFLFIVGDPFAVDNLLTELAPVLHRGVSINLEGTVIKVGLITVPFDLLCKTHQTKPDICRVCMLDCKFAHNATSGECGPHPTRPNETTCRCNYSPARRQPSVTSICKSSYSFNIFRWKLLDQKIDSLVKEVLQRRFETFLCSDKKKGCRKDCIENHGAKTGDCSGDYCFCRY